MKKLKMALAVAAALPLALVTANATADETEPEADAIKLEVVVHGTAGGGIVNWALYGDEGQHDSGKQMRGGRQDAKGASTLVTLGAVEPGRYSIAIFLDEDKDGEFDKNFLGIPKEPFGFSNDAMGAMGKPSFEKASFEVSTDAPRIEMTLKEL